MIFVISGRNPSKHSFIIHVGSGSSLQCLGAILLISFRVPSSVSILNEDMLVPWKELLIGGFLVVVQSSLSLILEILSTKKFEKLDANSLSFLLCGSGRSCFRWRAELTILKRPLELPLLLLILAD